MDDQFTPEAQAIIDQLVNAPQPRLSRRVSEKIHQQMLAEFKNPTQPAQPLERPRRTLTVNQFVGGIAAVFTLVVLIGLLLAANESNDMVLNSPTPPTQVAVGVTVDPSPTETFTDTAVPVMTETTAAITPTVPTLTPTVPTSTPTVPTATIPPTLTVSLEDVVVIEGQVQSIEGNVITIHNIPIQVAPNHPILNIISVGEILRIAGTTDGSMIVATVIDNLAQDTTDDATVGLEGPIEEIDKNIITVNGIMIEVDEEAPILPTLQIGDFLSVTGDFVMRSGEFVLVAVTLEQIAAEGTTAPSDCWYHDDGMGMGHWHCDGMGMGAMGMGDGMGMGP